MANEFLTRHDPQKKAERANSRQKRDIESKRWEWSKAKQIADFKKEKEEGKLKHTSVLASPGCSLASLGSSRDTATTSAPETNNSRAELKECDRDKRRPLKAEVRHEVHLRDKSQCQYRKPTGQICGNRSFLEFHHKTPVAQGGLDTADNLVLYGNGHHRATHVPFD